MTGWPAAVQDRPLLARRLPSLNVLTKIAAQAWRRGAVHRPGDPGQRPRPARDDLIQRPSRRGHRGDQAEQLFLVGPHPEVADHLAAVSDRAGQVGGDPAAVVDQRPG
jgi:hypothetical protein